MTDRQHIEYDLPLPFAKQDSSGELSSSDTVYVGPRITSMVADVIGEAAHRTSERVHHSLETARIAGTVVRHGIPELWRHIRSGDPDQL